MLTSNLSHRLSDWTNAWLTAVARLALNMNLFAHDFVTQLSLTVSYPYKDLTTASAFDSHKSLVEGHLCPLSLYCQCFTSLS